MNNYLKVGLLVLAVLGVYYVYQQYRKNSPQEGFESNDQPPTPEDCARDKLRQTVCDMMMKPAPKKTNGSASTTGSAPSSSSSMPSGTTAPAKAGVEGFMVNSDGYTVMPSEQLGDNETFKRVDTMGEAGEFGLGGNMYPKDCFPRDQLTPAELLPGDANSKWAQSVPAGQGELGDQNFLAAGFHIGVNTVGQTLRNANRQLRSEPPNPQVRVSPWLQSTIEPDTNRRPLEIAGCA
jgi:hypothetical protein